MFARTFFLLQPREDVLSFVFLVNPCAEVRGEALAFLPLRVCPLLLIYKGVGSYERGEDAGERRAGARDVK